MGVGKILLIKEGRVYITSQTLVCSAAPTDQGDPSLARTVVLIIKESRKTYCRKLTFNFLPIVR